MKEIFTIIVGVLVLGMLIGLVSDLVKEYATLIIILILIYAFVLSPHDKEVVMTSIKSFLNSIFH
jgi:hypothetical protein